MSYEGHQYQIGYFDTLSDARAALAIARGDAARGIFVPPATSKQARLLAAERERRAARMTLAEWSAEWLDRLADTGRTAGTVRAYRSLLDAHILPALGSEPLRAITPADVALFVAQLRALPATRTGRGNGNGVAAPAARCLRACLNAAVVAGHLETSPFKTPVPAERRARLEDDGSTIATPEQVAALARAMPDRLAVAVDLAAWCQLRLGEVLGLQRRDVEHLEDPNRATVHVRRQLNSKTSPPSLTDPKSDAGRRSIAIPPHVLPALRAHLERHTDPEPTAPVLRSRTGGYVSQSSFDRYWRESRAVVGMPGFRFHQLRHTGLTIFAQHGATVAEIMARGGHRSIDIALRYQHASRARDRELAARMSAAIDPVHENTGIL